MVWDGVSLDKHVDVTGNPCAAHAIDRPRGEILSLLLSLSVCYSGSPYFPDKIEVVVAEVVIAKVVFS
jgi:hypothetical protein